MTTSPAAGAPAANQFGVFQVHTPSAAQLRFVASLLGRKDVPTELDAEVEAYRNGTLNKKAATRLLDKLIALPEAPRPKTAAPKALRKPASDKQVALIRRLVTEKVWKDPGMTVESFRKGNNEGIWAALQVEAGNAVESWDASKAIDHLFASPRRPSATPAVELEAGMYRKDGVIYKVYCTVHGARKMCAKELVVIRTCEGHESTDGPIGNVVYCDGSCGSGETSAQFEYRGLAAKLGITADHRMSLEQAKEFGAIYGVCCQCGATLTAETSIEAGIGPVCAGRI